VASKFNCLLGRTTKKLFMLLRIQTCYDLHVLQPVFRRELISRNHRLNGSSSPVLTATSFSYGESKNSTPHRIKTPDPIEIKFGKADYVGKGTRRAKFYANPSKGGFSANE